MDTGRLKIAGTKYDRRVKLTEQDKEEIRRAYSTLKSKTQVAELFGVSDKTIGNVLYPEKYAVSEEKRKMRRALNPPLTDEAKERNKELAKETRRYRKQLIKKGRLK